MLVQLKVTPIDIAATKEEEVCQMMQECLDLQGKYFFRENVAPWEKEIITDPCTPKRNPNPFHYEHEPVSEHHFVMEDGVVHVYANKDAKEELFPVAYSTTFFTDLHRILRIIALGNVRTMCHHRLCLLEQNISLHLMFNADREFMAQKSAPHRDFYNVRKVDTHVHHSTCMNQKHLLLFIKSKMRKELDEVVIFRDGKHLTLKEVFESLDLIGYDLNVDLLDVYADKNLFTNLISHPKFISDTKLAIADSYKQKDKEFLNAENNQHRDVSSTTSIAVLVRDRLLVANVGNSQAVICRAGKVIALSRDHKPNQTDERKRIEDAGGFVMWAGTWHVNGVLAISHAFGGRLLKQYVVAEPEIQEEIVDNNVEFLILPSDGLWMLFLTRMHLL